MTEIYCRRLAGGQYFRTLPSPAGAGSYGALSRPLTCLSNACGIGGPCAPRMPAKNAPVAQLDRALDYESRGQEFESLRARHSTIFPDIVSRGRMIGAHLRQAMP